MNDKSCKSCDEDVVREAASRLFVLGVSDPSEVEARSHSNAAVVMMTLRLFRNTEIGFHPPSVRALSQTIHSFPSKPLVGADHELGAFLQLLRPLPRGTAQETWDKALPTCKGCTSRFTEWPTILNLERACINQQDSSLAYDVGVASGRELRACGIDVSWSPTVDIARENYHYASIGRSCASLSLNVIAALIKGQQEAGVAACAKHFPGMGAAAEDSHYTLPVIDVPRNELMKVDIAAFEAAVQAGVEIIMTNHAVYPALCSETPKVAATMCPEIITEVARHQMNPPFEGVIVTDDLGMMGALERYNMDVGRAVVAAIAAGCDLCMLCFEVETRYPLAVQALVDAVRSGELPLERLMQARRRVEALVCKYRPIAEAAEKEDAETALNVVGCKQHEELALRAGAEIMQQLGQPKATSGRWSLLPCPACSLQ